MNSVIEYKVIIYESLMTDYECFRKYYYGYSRIFEIGINRAPNRGINGLTVSKWIELVSMYQITCVSKRRLLEDDIIFSIYIE